MAFDVEGHSTLDLNHLVSAAIASRTGANVYNIMLAMSGWLALNPTCYLAHLDAWALTALAQHYPDACRRLLSLQSQDQNAVKVPGHLLPARTADSSSSAEDGLVVMRALGINDMARIERWSLFGVSFDADVTKLIQLDTDLADVIAGLRGGLSAHFVHHMLHRKISYQVVTEMLGAHLDRSTQWNNIRHQEIWHRFPRDSWERGITYEFIRLFFENWEDYSFDHRFVDLMFDSHDPLFVKLRTALEYVNSNKALNVSLRQDEADIQQARQARLISSWTAVGDAYMEASTHVHRRVLTGLELSPVFTESPSTSSSQHIPRKPTNHPPHGSSSHAAPKRTPVGKQLIESPKVDALSETLPMIYVAQAPAEMFGLPVMEAIINVKVGTPMVRVSFCNILTHSSVLCRVMEVQSFFSQCGLLSPPGWRMLLLLLMEHLLFMAFVIAYLMLITTEASACFGSLNQDDNTTTSDTPSLQPDGPTPAPPLAPSPPSARQTMSVPHIRLLAQCPQGAVSLCLDACLLWMCALALSSYIRQLQHTGLYFWLRKPNNWADLVTCALQASITVSHVSGCVASLNSQTMNFGLHSYIVPRGCGCMHMVVSACWYAMLVDRLGSLVRVISQIFQASPSAHVPSYTISPDGSDLLSGGQLALKLFTIALGDIDMVRTQAALVMCIITRTMGCQERSWLQAVLLSHNVVGDAILKDNCTAVNCVGLFCSLSCGTSFSRHLQRHGSRSCLRSPTPSCSSLWPSTCWWASWQTLSIAFALLSDMRFCKQRALRPEGTPTKGHSGQLTAPSIHPRDGLYSMGQGSRASKDLR
ncbi:hypothetical protein HaLaN_22279, partial [Haematococcus lacustris]